MSKKEEVSASIGCIPAVISLIVLWALLFGFTWNGQHHGVTCTCDRGVVVE